MIRSGLKGEVTAMQMLAVAVRVRTAVSPRPVIG
jgi:hypothetical protein